jgi:hypothetical protein
VDISAAAARPEYTGQYEVTLEVDDGEGGVTQPMFVLVVSAG